MRRRCPFCSAGYHVANVFTVYGDRISKLKEGAKG